MIDTHLLNLTIDGRPIQARPGQSVLQAATAAGIIIPTLCDHPALPPQGACRVCLVEIEKQRALQPACTFPAVEGMVVRTETERVVAGRRQSLQLIFSERQHYCMFCPVSGTAETSACELQKLAYRYKLDHWTYPPNFSKNWPLDTTHPRIAMEHSRCILCRRCVRACDHLAAVHALGVHHRGAKTMIAADDDVPLGESSCVSCGMCLQVCPTGALMDRRAMYLAREGQTQAVKSTCLSCALGCGIKGQVCDNQLVRVEGDWEAANAGLLCEAGRFGAMTEGYQRVERPLVRQGNELVPVGWDEAVPLIAKRFRESQGVAALVSPRTLTESLVAFACFFNEILQSDELALLYGSVPPMDLGTPSTLTDLMQADCVVLVGVNPLLAHPVAGFLVRRVVDHGAKLVIVSDTTHPLDVLAHVRLRMDTVARAGANPFALLGRTHHLRLEDLARLRATIQGAARPVVLYGNDLSTAVHASLRNLPGQVRFLPLVEGANAVGAAQLGISARPVRGEALYVVLGDEQPEHLEIPSAKFTVVQAAWRSTTTEAADVVLPARLWHEKAGTVTGFDGQRRHVVALTQTPAEVHDPWAVVAMIAAAMGRPLIFPQDMQAAPMR